MQNKTGKLLKHTKFAGFVRLTIRLSRFSVVRPGMRKVSCITQWRLIQRITCDTAAPR